MGLFGRIRWPGRGGGELLCPSARCGHRGRALATGGPAKCAVCRQALPAGDGAGFPVRAIALLGTDRCGQSSWLVRSFEEITREAERYRFSVEGQESQWEENLKALSLGRPVPSTPALPGIAWCLDFALYGDCRRVYVYDTAAEEVSDPRRLTRHQNLRHVDGLVVVVDPFGLGLVRQRYGHAIQDLRPPVRPTAQSFGETQLAVLLQSLGVARVEPRSGIWDVAVAVVVTKLDVLGLGRRLGSETRSTIEDIHEACRAQMAQWGFENMIRALDSHFCRVRFFGTWPGSRGPFAPGNALRWMFEESVGGGDH